MITIKGIEYYRSVQPVSCDAKALTAPITETTYNTMGEPCRVRRTDTGVLVLEVMHHNTEYARHYLLKTEAEIMEGWV